MHTGLTHINDRRHYIMPRTADLTPRTKYQLWLSEALRRRGMDLADLSRAVAREYNYIWKIGNGNPEKYPNARRPGYELALQIGEAVGDVAGSLSAADYTVADVAPGARPSLTRRAVDRAVSLISSSDVLHIPVLSTAGAGAALEHLELAEERIGVLRSALPSDISVDSLFAVRVRGYCLRSAFIADGDYLICRRSNVARDRDIVVVVTGEGDALAKRYRSEGGRRWLETDDGGPASVVLEGEARIVGVVVSRTGAPK